MKSSFKILFPTGYQVNSVENDNIDIHVVVSTGQIYFATLFTLKNIHYLMERENDSYFWVDSMLIVRNLEKSSIKDAIKRILEEEYGNVVLNEIGTIESIYGEGKLFEELLDMTE